MSKLTAWTAAHRKALVAYAGLALSLLSFAYPGANWLPVAVAAAAALGVHAVPNALPAPAVAEPPSNVKVQP